MRAKFVDVDGVRTRFLYEGSGRAVVLLHGFGVGADTWIRNVDALAKDFFIVAPDMLGQGFTAAIDLGGGPPHAKILRHLVRLLDTLEMQSLSVVGSSFGALIAGLLYFEMPERIDRLVLVSTGSVFNTDEQVPEMVEGAYRNALSAIRDPTLDRCRKRMANILYDPTTVPEEILLSQLTSYALPGVSDFWEAAVRGMLHEDASSYRIIDRLEEFAVPVLVVWGRHDPRGILESALAALPRLPHGRLVTFEDCGHLPYIERPGDFNEVVRDFLLASSDEPLTGQNRSI